jgi:membrane-associated phospholipid phosphatase
MSNINRIRLSLLVLFVFLALTVRIFEIVSVESNLLLLIHRHSTDSFDHLMLNVNAIGGPKPVLVFSLIFAVLAFAKKKKMVAIAVPIIIGFSGVLNIGLRALLHRHRPELWDTLIYDHSFVWSFPSGHACLAASFATAVTLALANTRYQKIAFIGGIAYCLIVAVTTLVLGVHYPLDVIGGWISGFLVVSVVWSVFQRFQTASTTETLREV